jgi:dynein heavy chain
LLQVLSLWLHETCRVFEDRLTCQEDHDWFKQHQVDLVQEHFAMQHSDIVSTECLMFGNYLVPGAEPKVSFQHHNYVESTLHYFAHHQGAPPHHLGIDT